MEYWQIIVLGVIQGITEFLPVSSSGHLILAPMVFNFADQGLALDAVLHLATLLAVIIFFKTDLLKLGVSLFKPGADAGYRRVAWSILLACFPAGFAGLLWGDLIETRFRDPKLVAINLLVWSFVFLAADRQSRKPGKKIDQIADIRPGPILWVGLAQAFALLPGTSRSGVTMAAGLFGNLSRTAAAKFSFLLGTPIIFAAGLHKMASLMAAPAGSLAVTPGQFLAGFMTSFVFGYFSIKVLLKIVSRLGLMPFIIYRILLSLLILAVY